MTNKETIGVLRACLIIATIDDYITDDEYKAGLEYLEECNIFEEEFAKMIGNPTYRTFTLDTDTRTDSQKIDWNCDIL